MQGMDADPWWVGADQQEILDMRRVIIAILVIAALAISGGFIANTAYQAGLAANVTVIQAGAGAGAAAGAGGTVVAPVVVPAYGWGWGWHGFGPGFGFFGFLGALFFLFLFIGLIRFAFGFGRWGSRGGWGGHGGPRGWGGPEASPWEARAHQTFEDWHRSAHGDPSGANSGGSEPPTPATPGPSV